MKWEDLVRERIRYLYDVEDDDLIDTRDWWNKNALILLCTPTNDQSQEILNHLDIKHLSLEQIEWAALKIAALESVKKECVEAFLKKKYDLLPRVERFRDSLRIAIVGSVGRFETTKEGDVDLNVIADIDQSEASFYVNHVFSDLVEPMVERANSVLAQTAALDKKGMGLSLAANLDDEDMRLLCLKPLLESSESSYQDCRACLCAGHYCINDGSYIAGDDPPDPVGMVDFQRRTRFNEYEQKLGPYRATAEKRPEENALSCEYKIVVSGLLMLSAHLGVAPEQWSHCYFRLAEILREKKLVNIHQWEAIQLAVLHCIEYRSVPEEVNCWRAIRAHIDSMTDFVDVTLCLVSV